MFTLLTAVSSKLYIRYISYEHKLVENVVSKKVVVESCRNSFKVFLFFLLKAVAFSRTPS